MTHPPSGPTRFRRVALIAIGLVVSAVATAAVVSGLDLERTRQIIAGADPGLLALALGLVAVQAGLRAARWQVLLPKRADGSRVAFGLTLRAMLVGYLGNAALPARLGEVVRSAMIARLAALPPAEVFGSAVLERVIDLFVLGLLGIGAATFVAAPGWMAAAATTGTIVAGGGIAVLGIVAVLGSRRAEARPSVVTSGRSASAVVLRIRRLVSQLAIGARVVDRPRSIGIAGMTTVAAWLLDGSIAWLVAAALGLHVSPAGAMLVSVVAVLSTTIPSAPGYFGTFELAAVAAVGVSGVTGEAALAYALVIHVVAVIPLSIAGFIAFWKTGGRGLAVLDFGSERRYA